MTNAEKEMIELLAKSNALIKRLYDKHQEYETLLDGMKNRSYLSAQEQLEEKRLKRLKLRGKEELLSLVQQDSCASP